MATLLDDELELDEDLLAGALAPSFDEGTAPPPPIDAQPANKDNGARPANAPDSVKQAAQAKTGGPAFNMQDFMQRTPEDEADVLAYKSALGQARQGRLAADIGQAGENIASQLLGIKPASGDFWQRQRAEAENPIATLRALSGIKAGQLAQKQQLAAGATNQMNAQAAARNAANTATRTALYQQDLEARAKKTQTEAQERAAVSDATSDTSRVAQDRYLESLTPEERVKWEPIVRRTPAKDLPGFQAITKREDAQDAAARKEAAEARKRAEAQAAQEKKEAQQAQKEAAAEARAEARAAERKEVASERVQGAYKKDLLPIEVKGRMLESNFGRLADIVEQAGPSEFLGDAGGKMRQLMSEIGVDRAKLMDPTSAAMFGEVEREMKNLWNPDTKAAQFALSKKTALRLIAHLRELSRQRVDTEYAVRGVKREAPPEAAKAPPTGKTYKVDFGGNVGVREVPEDKLQAALKKQGARLVE